jgi:hypothetical protein
VRPKVQSLPELLYLLALFLDQFRQFKSASRQSDERVIVAREAARDQGPEFANEFGGIRGHVPWYLAALRMHLEARRVRPGRFMQAFAGSMPRRRDDETDWGPGTIEVRRPLRATWGE